LCVSFSFIRLCHNYEADELSEAQHIDPGLGSGDAQNFGHSQEIGHMLSYLLFGVEEIYGCPLCGEDEPQTNEKDVILEDEQQRNEGIVILGNQ
jgi:hypothetical protein